MSPRVVHGPFAQGVVPGTELRKDAPARRYRGELPSAVEARERIVAAADRLIGWPGCRRSPCRIATSCRPIAGGG